VLASSASGWAYHDHTVTNGDLYFITDADLRVSQHLPAQPQPLAVAPFLHLRNHTIPQMDIRSIAHFAATVNGFVPAPIEFPERRRFRPFAFRQYEP